MTLTQLRYFHAACRFNSISEAARFLHISQPSVSGAIKELETEFGVSLFVRRYHGFSLTQCGKALQELADSLLKHADRVSEIMKDFGEQRNSIRLGVPPMIGTFLFPPIYRQFKEKYPKCSLITTEMGTRNLLEELNSETLDLAIVPTNNVPADQYSIIQLVEDETMYCVSRQHPLAREKTVSIPQIQHEPLVMFNHGFYQSEMIEQRFNECGLKPNIVHYTGQFYTLQKFILDNIATGFMLDGGAALSPDIAAIPLDHRILVNIGLVWKRSHHMYRDELHFIEFCQKIAKSPTVQS